MKFLSAMFKNSIEIPGPQTDALCAAARDANAYVMIGVCEKLPNTTGTMFNSQLYIGPDGVIIRKHQKIMPTVGERLLHGPLQAERRRRLAGSERGCDKDMVEPGKSTRQRGGFGLRPRLDGFVGPGVC